MENNLNQTLTQANELVTAQQPANILSMLPVKKETKEVSLKTLSKREIDKIMKAATAGKNIAKQYYDDTVEPEIKERTKIYNADKEYYREKFPRLSEKTDWRSRDVQTAADWIKPGLMEAFTGGDDPVDIKGVDVNDDKKAKLLQNIVKYQLERKNSFFSLMDYSLEEALRSNFGIAKTYWKHEEKREEYQVLLSENDVMAAVSLLEEYAKGNIEAKKMEPLKDAPDLLKVVFDRITVTANYPVVEFMPPSELLFTPEAATLQECKFVAHRKVVTGDYLKRKAKEGTFRNVDEAIKKQGETNPRPYEEDINDELRRMRHDLNDSDMASTQVELIEAYLDVDYNNDGIMEKVIVHMVDDIPLRIALNEFEFVPFFPCCVKYDANKIFSDYSYADTIEMHQDLKTALVKQMIINVAQQNAGQRIVDAAHLDMDALIDGDEIIAANGTNGPLANYVYAINTPQLSPQTMTLLEYAQNEIESQTGSTKYNQGLDSNSLNKTATGITAIMGAADKRTKLIARSIAENFYVPLVKAIILLDQKYLRDEEMFRINNENVQIRREDLDIDYDLIINVGAGAGTREARIQYLMILINQLIPMLTQAGIADEKTIYNAAKDLLEEMGLRSTMAFLQDPQSPEGQQKRQMAAQQQQQLLQTQMQQQEREHQVELLKAVLPRISIKYEDLPITSRQTLLQTIGLGADTGELIAKELLNDERNDRRRPPAQNGAAQQNINPQPGTNAGAAAGRAPGEAVRTSGAGPVGRSGN